MIGNIIKSLAASSLLLASAGVFAQSGNSGTSGSGGFNIDFFAGSSGGSNSEQPGGLTNAIEAAFGGAAGAGAGADKQDAEAGKRKP